jgi:hypothetical protein
MRLQVGRHTWHLGRVLLMLLSTLAPLLHDPVPVTSAAEGVILTFDPPALTLARGESQIVRLRLRTEEPISGIEVHLDFDATRLRVVNGDGHPLLSLELLNESPLPFILANRVDNTAGQIDYAAGRLERRGITGDFVLAELRLLAVKETEGTPATLRLAAIAEADSQEPVRTTLAATSGRSIPVTLQPLSVRIEPAVVRGRVGVRAAGSLPMRSSALSVQFSAPPVSSWPSPPPETRDATAQGDGTFTVIAPGAGTYDIAVRSPTSLRNVRRGVQVGIDRPGDAPLCFGDLAEGDANGDGQIGPADVAVVAGAFATSVGSAAFDARADFDRDRFVSVLDFSLLAFNYGLKGDQPATCAP